MLNVLDIFSGIGGFSLGLEAAGMQTVAFCEINPFCQKTLKNHWQSVPVFPDVTVLHKEDLKSLPQIDIIAGGFPCQDISIAGKKKGITAKRSGLWKEYKRLINEIRPKYAIIENVANLRSYGLVNVLQDLWEIGYNAEWHCIPASTFGALHRRDRIWIITHSTCNRSNVSYTNSERLQGHRGFEEISPICSQEQVSMYHSSKGIKQWGEEPLEVPRLKDERLNPDWVEWLMGYPISWTDGGSRMQRLMALGNSVVPLIPEFLGQSITYHYNNIS